MALVKHAELRRYIVIPLGRVVRAAVYQEKAPSGWQVQRKEGVA